LDQRGHDNPPTMASSSFHKPLASSNRLLLLHVLRVRCARAACSCSQSQLFESIASSVAAALPIGHVLHRRQSRVAYSMPVPPEDAALAPPAPGPAIDAAAATADGANPPAPSQQLSDLDRASLENVHGWGLRREHLAKVVDVVDRLGKEEVLRILAVLAARDHVDDMGASPLTLPTISPSAETSPSRKRAPDDITDPTDPTVLSESQDEEQPVNKKFRLHGKKPQAPGKTPQSAETSKEVIHCILCIANDTGGQKNYSTTQLGRLKTHIKKIHHWELLWRTDPTEFDLLPCSYCPYMATLEGNGQVFRGYSNLSLHLGEKHGHHLSKNELPTLGQCFNAMVGQLLIAVPFLQERCHDKVEGIKASTKQRPDGPIMRLEWSWPISDETIALLKKLQIFGGSLIRRDVGKGASPLIKPSCDMSNEEKCTGERLVKEAFALRSGKEDISLPAPDIPQDIRGIGSAFDENMIRPHRQDPSAHNEQDINLDGYLEPPFLPGLQPTMDEQYQQPSQLGPGMPPPPGQQNPYSMIGDSGFLPQLAMALEVSGQYDGPWDHIGYNFGHHPQNGRPMLTYQPNPTHNDPLQGQQNPYQDQQYPPSAL
jgi:hypothetical protein